MFIIFWISSCVKAFGILPVISVFVVVVIGFELLRLFPGTFVVVVIVIGCCTCFF